MSLKNKKILIMNTVLLIIFSFASFFLKQEIIFLLFKIIIFTISSFNLIIVLNINSNQVDQKPKNQQDYFLNLDTVINTISEGVFVVDDKNLIRLFNPAAESLTGYSFEDTNGMDYHSFIKLTDSGGRLIDESADLIKNAIITNQKTETKSLYLKTSNHQIVPISILAMPISSDSKMTVITFRDITKELDEERERMEFISTASHEMRTPLAALEGYLGLAINPKTATIDAKARSYLNKAVDSIKHLGALFQNLLSVSQADDKRLVINLTTINLNFFINNVITDFQSLAAQKGLTINFKNNNNRTISPEILIQADETMLREVLNNLIENAIKYTKKGGIELNLELDQFGNAVIRIKDSGIGIPPENISHLFQKFYRVDNSDTREIGGTGLGLYLTRKLTEAMRGRVWVESQIGVGSEFFLVFPRLTTEQAKKINTINENTIKPTK